MPFAPIHFACGPVVVTWNAIQLGYSEDGCKMVVQPFFDRVSSDDFGGRAGPPADEQLLGAVATIDIPFTKYVKAEMDKLSAFKKNGTAGILPPIGSFVRQDGLYATLLLAGINDNHTFLTAFLRRAQEINSGTKYRTYMVGFECWLNQTDYTQLSQAQNRTLFTVA